MSDGLEGSWRLLQSGAVAPWRVESMAEAPSMPTPSPGQRWNTNGGTEAVNGLIELYRRVARGFRNYDNYRLLMLLIGGGLAHPHLK